MNKSEKIIAAALTMALGVLFIVLKGTFIELLMTLLGACLIVLGVVDIINKLIPPAVVKMVSGTLVIICGWLIMEAVLYILAGLLLVCGILMLYQKIKLRVCGVNFWKTVLEYATPIIIILIGVLLLFNRAEFVNAIFIISGLLIFIEGGLLLYEAYIED